MKKTLLTLLICVSLLAAAQAQIVITEIMYNPPESGQDTLEYVELYNNTNATVDVSGWSFTQGFEFVFPAGFTIPANGYVVIAKNIAYFQSKFGFAPLEWVTGGALTNSGEDLELRDANGNVIDYVDYKNASPWPMEPNGNGPSLVLCDPSADNSQPGSWQGASNSTGIIINGKEVKANPGAAATCGAAPTFPARSIGEVTVVNGAGVNDSVGADVTLVGTVYGVNLRGTNGLQFTLIDVNNNGIAVFSQVASFDYTVHEGDRISVRGFIGQFNGLTQLLPESITVLSENNPLVSPTIVVNANETTESSLIRINGLTLVDPIEWDTTGNPSGFTVRAISSANPTDTVFIRIDNNTNLYLLSVPPTPFNVTGIGGQFDSSNPFSSGYQVSPRYIADISSLVATKEVDFSEHVLLTPNPTASGYLTVNTNLRFDRITFLSSTGIPLRTMNQPAMQEQIALSSLPAGTYLLRFERGGSVWTTRFVKL